MISKKQYSNILFPVQNILHGIWVFICCFPFFTFGQNLIPNPSFENYNNYRDAYFRYPSDGFPGIENWYRNTREISINWSDSIQKFTYPTDRQFYRPYDGQAYARLVVVNYPVGGARFKNTIQTALNDSLEGRCYYQFTMNILPEAVYPWESNPSDPNSLSANYGAVKSFGAYFSRNAFFDTLSPPGHAFDSVHIAPQIKLPQDRYITDTTNYTRITGTFKAKGGEKYITIGYFGWVDTMLIYKFYDQQVYGTGYFWRPVMLVDSLDLHRVSPPGTLMTSTKDTVMCPGDSLQLFTHAREALSINWDNGSTDSIRTITAPGTYWVDAYYPCGEVLSDTIVVTSNEILPPIAIRDTTICEGESVQYNLPPGPFYQLDGRAIGNGFSVTDEGTHTVKAITACENRDITFEIFYKPVDELPHVQINDTALCEGEEMRRQLPSGFNYTLNGTLLLSDQLAVSQQNQYTLTANNSCEKRNYTFTVSDEGCEMQLYIPNAFTPNGDGLNDCFEIFISEYQSFSITVFNRWGERVFESTNPENCWDGTVKGRPVHGSYTYMVRADDGNRKQTEYGVVTVIR